jgi:hypothetical protein
MITQCQLHDSTVESMSRTGHPVKRAGCRHAARAGAAALFGGIVGTIAMTAALAYGYYQQGPIPMSEGLSLIEDQSATSGVLPWTCISPTRSQDPWTYSFSTHADRRFGYRQTRIYELRLTTRVLDFSEEPSGPPTRFRASSLELGWPFLSFGGGWQESTYANRVSTWEARYLIRKNESATGRERAVGLPYWPLWWGIVGDVLVFGALTLVLDAVRRLVLRRFRHAQGNCRTCGYSLHALTTGICPECGTRYER